MSAIPDLDFSVDLLRSILWQYNDAARLQGILTRKQDWYNTNVTEFWEWWVSHVFNLMTADDFGLAVWGKILDESRDAFVPAQGVDYPAWGFGAYRKNFRHGNFRRDTAGFVRLSTDQYRLLLRLRYYRFISRGTVPEINAFIQMLFGDAQTVYVLDPLDMSFAIYVFDTAPASWQRFVLENMDALPRPAAVGAKIRIVTGRNFGFGQYHTNFGNGNFAEGA